MGPLRTRTSNLPDLVMEPSPPLLVLLLRLTVLPVVGRLNCLLPVVKAIQAVNNLLLHTIPKHKILLDHHHPMALLLHKGTRQILTPGLGQPS